MQTQSSDFMPIFMVVPGFKKLTVVHPTDPGVGVASFGPGLEDLDESHVRIGTMIRNADDSWLIKLAAMPLAGPLIARPPREGETQSLL